MRPFLSFIRKEFYHIFRDKRTMLIMLVLPVIQLLLFGYAITTEIQRVPIAVFDQSRDEVTSKIACRLAASDYFELTQMVGSLSEAESLFRRGQVKMVVVFPPGYAASAEAEVQLLADATDPNEATQLTAYATAVIASAKAEWQEPLRQSAVGEAFRPAGIIPVTQLLYNPALKGAYQFVPGVMGLILLLICALMTSVGIVREKEMGTMEVLLVSPMKPVAIILAKAIPYLSLSIIHVATILLLSYYLLEVPIAGSLPLLVAVSLLYALVSLCLGLLISTVADTQQAAMLISALVLMLPVILLSGMLFPIENMPVLLQWISHLVPAKWYILAVKDIMIKGLGAGAVLEEVGILLVMAVGLVIGSVKRFKIRL